MSRALSRGPFKSPEEEAEELQKRLMLLENERKTLIEESNYTFRQNKETILQLQKEHKDLRSQVKAFSKQTDVETFKQKPEETEEMIKLRRKLDQVRSLVLGKTQQIKTMQDKIKEISSDQKGTILSEDAPLMRQIRILENRLDKAMIKYNEAQSIKKTYEQIVKQLKQERVAYDNQLAAIERSLRGKEHDFEELLLLSHDANHAKETAEAELCRFEAQITVERMTREKNVEEKKEEVNRRLEATKKLELADKRKSKQDLEPQGLLSKITSGIANNAYVDQRNKEEKQKIKDYEEAFRRIKEATGVHDVNEIIQKFSTQEETSNNLEILRKEHQAKLEKLNEIKAELKKKVEGIKYENKGDNETRQVLDELEDKLAQVMKKYEKSKAKYQKNMEIIMDTKAGIEHIVEMLESVKLEGQSNIPVTDENLIEALIQNRLKMEKIYFQVKGSEVFEMFEKQAVVLSKPSDTAQRTASLLQTIYSVPQLSASSGQLEKGNVYNCRIKNQQREEEEDFSDDVIEDNLDSEVITREKTVKDHALKMEKLSKNLKAKRAASAVSKKKKP
jgi:coiled-coil domain-containing protein 151